MAKYSNFDNVRILPEIEGDRPVLGILAGLPTIEYAYSTLQRVNPEKIILVRDGLTLNQALSYERNRTPITLKMRSIWWYERPGQTIMQIRLESNEVGIESLEFPIDCNLYYAVLPVEIRTERYTFVFEDMPADRLFVEQEMSN